jgi:hypothetical protein
MARLRKVTEACRGNETIINTHSGDDFHSKSLLAFPITPRIAQTPLLPWPPPLHLQFANGTPSAVQKRHLTADHG